MQMRVLIIPTLCYALLGATVACSGTTTPVPSRGAGGDETTPEDENLGMGGGDGAEGALSGSDNGLSTNTDGSNANSPDKSGSAGVGGTQRKGAGGKKASAGAGGRAGRGGAGGTGGAAVKKGDCCVENTTPGCNHGAVQKCICEQLPDCCTKAWSQACVLLTKGHSCEPNVWHCVCDLPVDGGVGGGWGQENCCKQEWTSFCEVVAVEKCNPTIPGCSE